MLRSNLSTRPFYNERAIHLILALAAVLILVLTGVTVYQMIDLSRKNTALSSGVNRDRAEADRLTREATRIRRGINQDELQVVVTAAREANSLIDQRTFSWTEFFNRIERTLPADVMLTGVQPAWTDEGMKVNMTVVGRRVGDINEFIGQLDNTGAFRNSISRLSEEIDNGMMRVVIETYYEPIEAPKPGEPSKSANGDEQ